MTVNRNAAEDEQLLPPEAVAQAARDERADEAADQGATVGPADLRRRGQIEKLLEKGLAPPMTTQS